MEPRIFQGHTTRQRDGHTGKAADQAAWYFEPADYEGDVLWSAPYATRAEAETAAHADHLHDRHDDPRNR